MFSDDDKKCHIIDRSGRKVLPIGRDGFAMALDSNVLVDKTMLIADILDSGYAVTLFCRPRRFGKTLNMTMMRAFLEIPTLTERPGDRPSFEGTVIWDAAGGKYRVEFQHYPVVHISFNTVKKDTWQAAWGEIRGLIAREYDRHSYLADSKSITPVERAYVNRIIGKSADDADFASSLIMLTSMLYRHHGIRPVVLIDEYDAPVMAAYSSADKGYHRSVITFLKGWLTGALKDGGEALAFACLTGVQRISKESIFSDLNNLVVNTPLSREFDRYFGFTSDEVAALAGYLGCEECLPEAKAWYDGYRFGSEEVYNPWSVLNYLRQGCTPGTYWSNTSSNAVVADLLKHADDETFSQVCRLLGPDGVVAAPLDLGVVFPDVGIRADAIWSMLYLAGYLTTDLTAMPDDYTLVRPLRIPNQEVARLYRSEIISRFGNLAGGVDKLVRFRRALVDGDESAVTEELSRIAMRSASVFDLVSENSCHMLLLGICFGIPGYGDPRSNREGGLGRFDIQIEPVALEAGAADSYGAQVKRPRITIEVKFSNGAQDADLEQLAHGGLLQIRDKGYDEEPLGAAASGRLRWGIAFAGKRLLARCERV